MNSPARKDYKDLLEKVEARHTQLKDKWYTSGDKAWGIYLGDEAMPFNILYSNTETIVPAVFSKKPIPKVLRRHDQTQADAPAMAGQRYLSFSMDTNLPTYPSFMTSLEDAVLDAAIPGQGLVRVRKVGGQALLDYVEWNKFVWGYCTRWEMLPWIAFAHDMTPDEVLAEFPDLSAEQKKAFKESVDSAQGEQTAENGEKKPFTVRVWETWVKNEKMRHFLCEHCPESCLESKEDPLKLNGFFPIPPKPLIFVHNTTDTLPRPLYKLYQQQAEELNEITRRLTKVIKAIKVRGLYASGMDDLERVLNEDDDNVLIPSKQASQVVTTGKGLDAYIWLMPVKELMAAAKELYFAREQVKQTIYEILGIGDILRGVSKASETLGAQQIKAEWGSLRINRTRERVTTFIRDSLRLLLDCAAKNCDESVWAAATGLPLKTTLETTVLQQAGQQVPPMATWQGVLGVLQNDLHRAYLIDIETNSSVDAEATQEKAELAEFMNAFGQALAGLKDVMASGPQGWELGKKILSALCAKFELGAQLVAQIEAMSPPQPGQSPEQMQKMMQEVQKRMEEVGKREQALKDDEGHLKDSLNEIKRAQEALKGQEEDLKLKEKSILREVEFAKREAVLEIREEKMAVDQAKQAVALQGQQNEIRDGKRKNDISKMQAQQQQNSQNKGK